MARPPAYLAQWRQLWSRWGKWTALAFLEALDRVGSLLSDAHRSVSCLIGQALGPRRQGPKNSSVRRLAGEAVAVDGLVCESSPNEVFASSWG